MYLCVNRGSLPK